MSLSKRVLCIAGKSQAAVDVLNGARDLPDITLVCLPNKDDDGVDGWQPSLRKAAERQGIEIVTLDWAMEQPDLCFMSVEYDSIVRPERFACDALFNIHFSLLPKFRGCNTAVWPILTGEALHGVTLHEIDAGVDTGAIIAQRSFPIGNASARDLYFRCMELGSALVLEWLPRLLAGDYQAVAQTEENASLYRRKGLDFSAKEIDPSATTEQVMRRIRAFTFPEYQRPTFRGADILAAEPLAPVGLAPFGTVDGAASEETVTTADGAVRLVLAR